MYKSETDYSKFEKLHSQGHYRFQCYQSHSLIFMQLQIFSIMLRSGGCAGQINLETPFSVF